jgi:hypothetical protein
MTKNIFVPWDDRVLNYEGAQPSSWETFTQGDLESCGHVKDRALFVCAVDQRDLRR